MAITSVMRSPDGASAFLLESIHHVNVDIALAKSEPCAFPKTNGCLSGSSSRQATIRQTICAALYPRQVFFNISSTAS